MTQVSSLSQIFCFINKIQYYLSVSIVTYAKRPHFRAMNLFYKTRALFTVNQMENEFAARSCKSSELFLNSIALHFKLLGAYSCNSHAPFWHVAKCS